MYQKDAIYRFLILSLRIVRPIYSIHRFYNKIGINNFILNRDHERTEICVTLHWTFRSVSKQYPEQLLWKGVRYLNGWIILTMILRSSSVFITIFPSCWLNNYRFLIFQNSQILVTWKHFFSSEHQKLPFPNIALYYNYHCIVIVVTVTLNSLYFFNYSYSPSSLYTNIVHCQIVHTRCNCYRLNEPHAAYD